MGLTSASATANRMGEAGLWKSALVSAGRWYFLLCDLRQLIYLLWALVSSPIKLGVGMADLKNPCRCSSLQFNNDV